MGERSVAPRASALYQSSFSKPPVAVQLPQPDVSANRDAPHLFKIPVQTFLEGVFRSIGTQQCLQRFDTQIGKFALINDLSLYVLDHIEHSVTVREQALPPVTIWREYKHIGNHADSRINVEIRNCRAIVRWIAARDELRLFFVKMSRLLTRRKSTSQADRGGFEAGAGMTTPGARNSRPRFGATPGWRRSRPEPRPTIS